MASKKYEPKIEIFSDSEILAQRAVEIFAAETANALAVKESFFAALSGGSTPKRFFELLGTSPKSKALPWNKIHLFWVDERYVPITSSQNNYKTAADIFLNKVAIPDENIHRIPTEFNDINDSVRKYEEIIRKEFKLEAWQRPVFNFIMLGMGSDGHTASLFPNSCASFDMDNLACAVYHTDEKLNRVTLTKAVLCEAKHIIVMIQGKEKAAVLKDVFTTEPDEIRYPIQILWPVLDKVTWLIDKEAAVNL
jgi:6-phosphogluconolactonase